MSTIQQQPVLNSNILNNTNSSSPLLIAQASMNTCILPEDQLSNANLYSNNQTEYMFNTISSENSIEPMSTLTISQSITSATLPQTHFNPITPLNNNNNSNNIDPSYYSPQSVYNSSVNMPSQLVQPLITPTNHATSTNITIKPVPIVNNIQQIILTNNNNGSSASSSPTPSQQPQPSSKVPLVNNSSSSTNSPVALTLTNIENRETSQPINSSSGPISTSSINNSLSTPSTNQQINNTTPAMISNLNEQVQTNMEKIQQTQSSIGQISSQISKPTTNQIFSNSNSSNQQQQSSQKDSNIIIETSNNANLNEAPYSQQNILISLNDQSSNQLTSNLTSNGTNSSSLSLNSANKSMPLQYQSQSQLQQQIPPVNYENLNVNVSINNSSSSNSDYNQSSPKEHQQLQQQLTSSAIQMINSNSLSNQSSSSINAGINTPPLSSLTTNTGNSANSTVSNLASSSSSAFIDQTTATLDLLMNGTETNWNDLNKKPLDADKGIKSRIELAMDLVKTHLTSAVNQEIVVLKSQIKQLTEKCTRLEQENSILRKHALPETLSLVENRGSILIPNQTSTNIINNNSNVNNCLQSVNNGLNAMNSSVLSSNDVNHGISTPHPVNSNESANNTLLSITVDNLNDCMTNSLTEHILNNNDPLSDTLLAHSSLNTFNEIESLKNHNIHISDESILNINETK